MYCDKLIESEQIQEKLSPSICTIYVTKKSNINCLFTSQISISQKWSKSLECTIVLYHRHVVRMRLSAQVIIFLDVQG